MSGGGASSSLYDIDVVDKSPVCFYDVNGRNTDSPCSGTMKNNKRILPRRGECNDQQQQEQNLHDPFHSYFESYYENAQAKDLTRGESANIFGQSSEDVTMLTDRRRRGQQSQRKLLETATTTGHRRLEELMAARERYLERPDEQQQVDHGGDRGGTMM